MATQPKIAPLPSNAPPFAHEFTKRMRMRKDVTKPPSVRQTQSIPMLLSARFFRNGKLTLDDFLDAAVYTTFPPDQKIAREIAEDILLGREKEPKKPDEQAMVAKIPAVKTDALAKVMDQIKREQELAKVIKKDKVEAGYEYLLELRKEQDKSLYNASKDYLTDGEIVLRGITSNEELKETASAELMDKFGDLSSQDMQNSQILDCLDQVCDSPNAAEQIAASSLRGDKDIQEQFSDLSRRDTSTAARALRHMEEMGTLTPEQQKEMDQKLQDDLDDLSEVADYARELGRVPDNIDKHIKEAAQKFSLSDAAEFARNIKESTGIDIMDDLLEQYDLQYDSGADQNVDLRQLAENARQSDSWKSLVEKEAQSVLASADSRSSPSDFLRSSLAQNQQHEKNLPSQDTKKQWDKAMQKFADGAVERSPTKSHLRQTVKHASRLGQVPSEKAIREAGERLNMTEEEILELINPSFEVIKKLIQAGVNDFERLHNLMSSAGLSPQQLRQLGDMAAEQGNQGALGAVAHEDLHAALGTAGSGYRPRYGRPSYGAQQGPGPGTGQPDKDRVDLAFGGLLGGPATNIIKIWYTYRDELPPDLKKRLLEIAKRLLIDLGMRYARQTMGSSMLGGIQESTTVRPFRIGDDIDLINLEETIDALLAQGRTNFKIIETSDFLVTETYQGHRAFYWALDKSGSMDAPKKLGMLAISVMAGLYGIKKDDFGVVLFDNMTHVVKEISQRTVAVEKVAADLLEARAGGGTGGQESIRLALRNFEDSKAKEKIFIFATDMYLSDQKICEDLVERMKPLGIKLIVLVPTGEHNPQAAHELAKKGHGVVLDIDSIDELPAKLLRVTNY
ncbi:VWA domain-containing protein [Candidatus Thorarchaeota archaeon]|nr:MAG: VWA domain-containing protein [Candidatus Thorarchaeota archaeon]